MFNSKQIELFSVLYMKYNNEAFTAKSSIIKEQYNLGKRDMIKDLVTIFNGEEDAKKLWKKELSVKEIGNEEKDNDL
jgi:hypothetical protein